MDSVFATHTESATHLYFFGKLIGSVIKTFFNRHVVIVADDKDAVGI